MAFAPVMNNIGPALMQQGFQDSAAYSMQGAEAMAGGISSAGSSIASSLEKLAKKQQDDAQASGEANGIIGAIGQYKAEGIGDAAGYEDFANSFSKAKSPQEKLGMAMTFFTGLEGLRKTAITNTQMAGQGQRQQAGFQNAASVNAAKPTMTGVPVATKPAYFGGN